MRKGRSTIEIHFDTEASEAADIIAEAEDLARKIIYDSPKNLEIDLEATEEAEPMANARQPEKLS